MTSVTVSANERVRFIELITRNSSKNVEKRNKRIWES